MWNSIVSVPDGCLFIYFGQKHSKLFIQVQILYIQRHMKVKIPKTKRKAKKHQNPKIHVHRICVHPDTNGMRFEIKCTLIICHRRYMYENNPEEPSALLEGDDGCRRLLFINKDTFWAQI